MTIESKLNLEPLVYFLERDTPVDELVKRLIEVEEDYVDYHLRYDDHYPGSADILYTLRALRKALQQAC
jgi:hypothetical protein